MVAPMVTDPGKMDSREGVTLLDYFVSVSGRDEGYTVKYTPLPDGVPEGTPEGKGLYLTKDPRSSPNTDIISF